MSSKEIDNACVFVFFPCCFCVLFLCVVVVVVVVVFCVVVVGETCLPQKWTKHAILWEDMSSKKTHDLSVLFVWKACLPKTSHDLSVLFLLGRHVFPTKQMFCRF